MKLSLFLVFTLHLFISMNVYSALPPNYTAVYDVETYRSIVGRSTIKLDQDNDKLLYSQEIELVGIAAWFKDDHVMEKSWINKSEKNGFLLNKYEYIHSNGNPKKNRNVKLESRWADDKKSAEFNGSAQGEKVLVKTEGPVWDILSMQLALMNDITDKKGSLDYQVFSKGELNEYTFNLIGAETVTVNEKEYQTLRAERVSGNKIIRLYLAPKLYNVPVLIENYKNGELDNRAILNTVTFENQKTESSHSNNDVFDE